MARIHITPACNWVKIRKDGFLKSMAQVNNIEKLPGNDYVVVAGRHDICNISAFSNINPCDKEIIDKLKSYIAAFKSSSYVANKKKKITHHDFVALLIDDAPNVTWETYTGEVRELLDPAPCENKIKFSQKELRRIGEYVKTKDMISVKYITCLDEPHCRWFPRFLFGGSRWSYLPAGCSPCTRALGRVQALLRWLRRR